MPRDPAFVFSTGTPILVYNVVRKWMAILSCVVGPLLLIIDAPFGRFTIQNQDSIFLFDGIKSWMVMELVSPTMLIYTFLTSPLSSQSRLPSLTEPQTILAACFLVHYANRAVISPLRTPSRSKSHIIVPVAGVVFNTFNGSLMGSYLSSPFTRILLATRSRTPFYLGLTLWAAGLAGNIVHDEILFDIRRNAKVKEKNGSKGEHYAIPQGLLYNFVSYPNYLCEWLEWLGFAIAASPFPFTLNGISLAGLLSLVNPTTYTTLLNQPAQSFLPTLSPPWIFLLSEFFLMLPRAYRGHQWYHKKFGARYPANRRAVIPFLV